jgi:hypothetical protein
MDVYGYRMGNQGDVLAMGVVVRAPCMRKYRWHSNTDMHRRRSALPSMCTVAPTARVSVPHPLSTSSCLTHRRCTCVRGKERRRAQAYSLKLSWQEAVPRTYISAYTFARSYSSQAYHRTRRVCAYDIYTVCCVRGRGREVRLLVGSVFVHYTMCLQ